MTRQGGKPCGFVLSGESVAGAVPSPVVRVASPGPARAAAGRGTILHLGAVGYRLLRTIFTSDNVALISITSTSQPAHGQKGAGGKSRPVVHAGGSGRFSVQPACSDQDHQHHERQQHANDECDNDYGAVTFHGTCASDSVLGFRGHRYPTARWCWWLVPARLLAANSVAGRGAHPRLASARNNLYGLM